MKEKGEGQKRKQMEFHGQKRQEFLSVRMVTVENVVECHCWENQN